MKYPSRSFFDDDVGEVAERHAEPLPAAVLGVLFRREPRLFDAHVAPRSARIFWNPALGHRRWPLRRCRLARAAVWRARRAACHRRRTYRFVWPPVLTVSADTSNTTIERALRHRRIIWMPGHSRIGTRRVAHVERCVLEGACLRCRQPAECRQADRRSLEESLIDHERRQVAPRKGRMQAIAAVERQPALPLQSQAPCLAGPQDDSADRLRGGAVRFADAAEVGSPTLGRPHHVHRGPRARFPDRVAEPARVGDEQLSRFGERRRPLLQHDEVPRAVVQSRAARRPDSNGLRG